MTPARGRIGAQREQRLNATFDFFDLDESGELDETEFFQIGKVCAGVASAIAARVTAR